LFRKAAEIRNYLAHNLLKHYWSAGPRGGYHRRTRYAKIKQLKKVEKTTLLKYPQKVIMKICHQKRNYK
jgi:hypothetical protein